MAIIAVVGKIGKPFLPPGIYTFRITREEKADLSTDVP
jgi:hypothetical protein